MTDEKNTFRTAVYEIQAKYLRLFVVESNRIEGILREPTREEIEAYERFLKLPVITVLDLKKFVSIIQPGASLRDKPGMDVRVGDHIAPAGGPKIADALNDILVFLDRDGPYRTHVRYETLHPFMDGNGRSGRVLWLWQMYGNAPLGFLHTFYYQALAASRV